MPSLRLPECSFANTLLKLSENRAGKEQLFRLFTLYLKNLKFFSENPGRAVPTFSRLFFLPSWLNFRLFHRGKSFKDICLFYDLSRQKRARQYSLSSKQLSCKAQYTQQSDSKRVFLKACRSTTLRGKGDPEGFFKPFLASQRGMGALKIQFLNSIGY